VRVVGCGMSVGGLGRGGESFSFFFFVRERWAVGFGDCFC
jgi:hypothetical protein